MIEGQFQEQVGRLKEEHNEIPDQIRSLDNRRLSDLLQRMFDYVHDLGHLNSSRTNRRLADLEERVRDLEQESSA